MRIALIGAGRLAEQLGLALAAAGHAVDCVYSRTMPHAEALAAMIGATPTCDIDAIPTDADAYIIAVKDDAIAPLARRLCPGRGHALFVHTAGSVDMGVFAGLAPRHGVLYPMQTFSHGRRVCFADIPCFIEGSTAEATESIRALAQSVSRRVMPLDGAGRKRLHLAAVFACNFANHCYSLAASVLHKGGIPFDTMLPLIAETASKVGSMPPRQAQTGPAVRYDEQVMQAQMALLGDDELSRRIYQDMSMSIHQMAQSDDQL